MLLYVFNKATYEISRASFLPLRVETLGRVHREKIYDLLVKLENTELQRLNLYGYHHFVKRARVVAGQSVCFYALLTRFPSPYHFHL